MKLIIAEKPSLGRNIATGIGNMKQGKGFLEGNGYIITWAFGHLFSLCDIESYQTPPITGKVRWSMNNIPCFPEKFCFELKKDANGKTDNGIQNQYQLISSLCNRADVDTIINAGDADREGEIIVRLCVMHALKSQKPFYRLWLPDQTPQTVQKALSELKPESEYDLLAEEGFARTYIDWLYGVNLTRLATLRAGSLLRVGRVIVPIVKAIYDRDLAIRNFVPGKYYTAVSRAETNGQVVELTSKNKFEDGKNALAECGALCKKYNDTGAVVTSVQNKKDKLNPPKLYSLSTLQNALSKKYKMSMNDSLSIVQNLYEKGYLTYPRTNSEYLATAEKDKVKQILDNIKKIGYPVAFRDGKTIFDDSKIESHSALTPTYKIPNKTQLTDAEMKVYSTVFRRFVAVFCAEPCVCTKSEIKIDVGDLEQFVLKGTVIVEPGWTKYDDYNQKDKILPNLTRGQTVNIDFQPTEKETTPPKHYTVETLNAYLKNPFREEKKALQENENEDDTEEYRAILEGLELGTEATRTGIIENARKSKYIELKKDTYYILPGGEYLMESLSRMQINMDKSKTSMLGQALKKVFHGTITTRDAVALAEQEIAEIFGNAKKSEGSVLGDAVGVCPLCGKTVERRSTFYGCTGYPACRFTINAVIAKKELPKKAVEALLRGEETEEMDGFLSKAGKPFRAKLKITDGKVEFVFAPRPQNNTITESGYGDEIPLPEPPPERTWN